MPIKEESLIVYGPELEHESKYSSLGKFVFDSLKSDPTFIGQVETLTEHEDTYGDMLDRSVRVALWLRSKNIGPGDIVSYCSDNHRDSTITFFGCLYVGAALNPWSPVLSTKEIAHLMGITKPKVIFSDEKSVETVKAAAKQLDHSTTIVVYGDFPGSVTFRDTQKQAKDDLERFRCTELNENDLALVACSSGTTGFPKGVQISHKALLIPVEKMVRERSNYPPNFISFSSLYWLTGVISIFYTIGAKCKLVVTHHFEEEYAWKMIEKYQAGWAIFGTSMMVRMAYCSSAKKYDASSLRFFIVGGGLLTAEVYQKINEIMPNCKILQVLGMTELGGSAAIQTEKSKPGSCGRLEQGVSCKIVDPETGKTINPHTPGEICWKHPGMFLGYHNDPVQTKLAFDSEGWFHSGDLGYFNEDDEMFVTDRLKELLKYHNYQIVPAELEAILAKHPGVKHVGVVGKRVDKTEDYPVAFVVRTAGSNVTKEELCDFLAKEVPDEKRLRGGVRFLPEMPMTPSGKVMKKALREMINAETTDIQ